ncbi:MAG: tRNA dihydrouridine(20/20a) synthase DusA [Gammaproteobacteria bacterium]|nr:MAG: tRNA dihydrouridine(20/20a) synthase DusA [Gammaproteobacteria bacterium]
MSRKPAAGGAASLPESPLMSRSPDYRLCVAPMMDWTDRHCRYFHRILAPDARLYTEMVTAAAVVRGDRDRLLAFDPTEHPLALQLGGSDPEEMAQAASLAEAAGYDEINVNVGCPSDRVQSGRFGACLMATPVVVRDCVAAMAAAVDKPVTVKSRIGIDDVEDFRFLRDFVAAVADGGCRVFIVHARNAILEGLSPKENRDVPPLRYEFVHRLKEEFPELTIVINGGIRSLEEAQRELSLVDGVMIGREAYHNPWILSRAEQAILGGAIPKSREAAVVAMLPYVRRQLGNGVRLHSMTRHMLGIFAGQPGARAWRRHLSENGPRAGAGAEVIEEGLNIIGRRSG